MYVNIGDLRPAHPQTDCPSHPTPTSLAAPRFLLICAPPVQAVGCCGFSAARPRPLRQRRGDKELCRLAPARPQGATRLSVARREEEISHQALARPFISAESMLDGCWVLGPWSRAPGPASVG